MVATYYMDSTSRLPGPDRHSRTSTRRCTSGVTTSTAGGANNQIVETRHRKTYRHDLNSRFLRCRGAALTDDAATLASSISHPLDVLLGGLCQASLSWEAIDSTAVAFWHKSCAVCGVGFHKICRPCLSGGYSTNPTRGLRSRRRRATLLLCCRAVCSLLATGYPP